MTSFNLLCSFRSFAGYLAEWMLFIQREGSIIQAHRPKLLRIVGNRGGVRVFANVTTRGHILAFQVRN